MANTVTNVTAGTPKIGGAISVAPSGTSAPTSASAALTGFTDLGYVDENGVTNANSPNTTAIKAWGGDTVLQANNGKTDTFQFTLIEVLNPDVLKLVYGDENVTGTLATGIAVKANNALQPEHVLVIDMVLRGGVLKRIVIPKGAVTSVADVVYKDTQAVGYQTTITAYPDTSGNTHYEYIVAGSST